MGWYRQPGEDRQITKRHPGKTGSKSESPCNLETARKDEQMHFVYWHPGKTGRYEFIKGLAGRFVEAHEARDEIRAQGGTPDRKKPSIPTRSFERY